MIVLQDVWKSFDGGRTYAVKGVTLKVNKGETLVLLGSSGSGKTTVLKMINRLIEPTKGTIEIDGRNVQDLDPIALRRSIGYVFQGIGLFPHLTVAENVSIVLRVLGRPKSERRRRAEELLALVGLEPKIFADRYPDELSGGQQQRVGVARALAADPDYLLMDEPFGALDAVTRDILQQELLRLKEQLRKTIVFVTHDIFEAFLLADRIAVMHQGRIEQVGTKEQLLHQPATDFVRELLAKPLKHLASFHGPALHPSGMEQSGERGNG
ncbi:ATP-binding cassette domain-containing protein [Fervidibacter sacchari]|uniref:Osmoprotectant transport system ATP-binding protein n=1 Tax=Candidatus Fervidibacter sacchari TaxID=1448929 RepID=A0ABT2ERU9_9BACT|nr:ATP-binding cassette domain-containing protein [Candidatus Fervidibacter sacchari]MCS3919648.1 osmoprotectant transport system ATP-binding protein [Candidatus Fervidibacter sacchari]WKU15365.1 ATP-binding cassette domain-containing protein [Candidatus Fervidibacter sacchari]